MNNTFKEVLKSVVCAVAVCGGTALTPAFGDDQEIGWTIDEDKIMTEVLSEEETSAGVKPWIIKLSGSWADLPWLGGEAVNQVGDHTTLDFGKRIVRASSGAEVKINYKSSVFSGKTTIEKLILSRGLYFTSSSQQLFSGCTGLKTVETFLPDSMARCPARLFDGCTALTGDVVMKEVSEVGIYAFQKCKITSVYVGPKCTVIGYGAFASCTALSNVVIASTNGWSTSGGTGKMFDGCTALKNFTMQTFPKTIYANDFSPYSAKSTYASNKHKICFFIPKDIVDEQGLLTNGLTPWDDLDEDVKAAFKTRWADMGVKKALGVIKDTQTSGASWHYGIYTLPANQFVAYIPEPKTGMKVLFK